MAAPRLSGYCVRRVAGGMPGRKYVHCCSTCGGRHWVMEGRF